jgi:hypothetical protein
VESGKVGLCACEAAWPELAWGGEGSNRKYVNYNFDNQAKSKKFNVSSLGDPFLEER